MNMFTRQLIRIRAGQEVRFGPFPVNDAARSVRVDVEGKGQFQSRLEVKDSFGKTLWGGGFGSTDKGHATFGAGQTTNEVEMVDGKATLKTVTRYFKNQNAIISFKALTDFHGYISAHNSITIGTPQQGDGFLSQIDVILDAGSASYRYMLAGVYHSTQVINSLTWNGVALSAISGADGTSGNSHARLFGLINPVAGSQTLSLVMSGAVDCSLGGIPFSGVDQTTPADSGVGTTGTSAQAVLAVASGTDHIGVDIIYVSHSGANGTCVPDASQTHQISRQAYDGAHSWGMSTKTGATSINMTWDMTKVSSWRMAAANIRAATGLVSIPIGMATETDSAYSLANQHPYGMAVETDEAFSRFYLAAAMDVDDANVNVYTALGTSLNYPFSHNHQGNCLMVGIAGYQRNGIISGVTWDGANVPLRHTVYDGGGSNNDIVHWYAVSTTNVGTKNVELTFSTLDHACYVVIFSIANADAAPFGNVFGDFQIGDLSPLSTAVAVAAGSMAFDILCGSLKTMTPDASQTALMNTGSMGESGAASYKVNATEMVWTYSGSMRRAHAVLEIKAAGAAITVQIPVGMATETDTAYLLPTNTTAIPIGIATETDSAPGVVLNKRFPITLPGNVALEWDANTEPDLAGYHLWIGLASLDYDIGATFGAYTNPINIAAPVHSYYLQNLPPGNYYFAVSAYDTELSESGFSNEATAAITGPPQDVSTAFGSGGSYNIGYGMGEETDTAYSLAGPAVIAIGMATETDSALALTLVTAEQTTFYVATNGDDAAAGSIVSPFRTIAQGCSKLAPGKTLYIRGGTYTEGIEYWQIVSGSQAQPIVVSAYAGEIVTLRPPSGDFVIRAGYDRSYISFKKLILDGTSITVDCAKLTNLASYITFEDCEMLNGPQHGLIISACDNNIIRRCRMHDNGSTDLHHCIYNNGGSNNVVEECELYNTTGYGIHQYDGDPAGNIYRRNVIHNTDTGILLSSGGGNYAYYNLLYSNGLDIQYNYSETNSFIWNNTCYGSNGGITLFAGTVGASVKNNICWGMSNYGFRDYGSISPTVLNNLLQSDPYNPEPSGNLIDQDPFFTNAAGLDFSLQSVSPAINVGVDVGLSGGDVVGRALVGLPDMGCYEYLVAITVEEWMESVVGFVKLNDNWHLHVTGAGTLQTTQRTPPEQLRRFDLAAELHLDNVTKRYAKTSYMGAVKFYESRVIAFGDVIREIAVQPGDFRISGLHLELNNSDGAISALRQTKQFLNRPMHFLFGDPALGEEDLEVIGVGRIDSWSGSAQSYSIEASDITLQKFEKTITPTRVATRTLFPVLLDSESRELIPLVIGKVSSEDSTKVGAIKALLIDQYKFVYIAAQGTITILNVYVDGVRVTTGYTVSQQSFGSGLTLGVGTFITFSSDKGSSTVSFDADGLKDEGNTIQNPAKIWKRVLLESEFAPGDLDDDSFTAAESVFEVRQIRGAFAETDKTATLRAIAQRMAESFNMTTVITKGGRIGVTVPEPVSVAPANAYLIDEPQVVQGSFQMRSLDVSASSIDGDLRYNYNTGEFEDRVSFIDSRQKNYFGNEELRIKTELRYVTDPASAGAVLTDKLFFSQEQRIVVEFLADPEVYRQLDIGQDVRLTHWAGPFTEQMFRVVALGLTVQDEAVLTRVKLVDMTELPGTSLTEEWKTWMEEEFRAMKFETDFYSWYGVANEIGVR